GCAPVATSNSTPVAWAATHGTTAAPVAAATVTALRRWRALLDAGRGFIAFLSPVIPGERGLCSVVVAPSRPRGEPDAGHGPVSDRETGPRDRTRSQVSLRLPVGSGGMFASVVRRPS